MKVIIANDFTDLKEDEYLVSPLKGSNINELEFADAECEEIVCLLTDKIPYYQLGQTIRNYATKLRHGGKIQFIGTDLMQAILSIKNRSLGISDANHVLYGGPESWNKNQSMVCGADVAELLSSFGLRITRRTINGLKYLVEAVRD